MDGTVPRGSMGGSGGLPAHSEAKTEKLGAVWAEGGTATGFFFGGGGDKISLQIEDFTSGRMNISLQFANFFASDDIFRFRSIKNFT